MLTGSLKVTAACEQKHIYHWFRTVLQSENKFKSSPEITINNVYINVWQNFNGWSIYLERCLGKFLFQKQLLKLGQMSQIFEVLLQ